MAFYDKDNIEEVPAHFSDRAMVQVRNLTKEFSQGLGGSKIKTTAVNALNLIMYQGQITALLGHNGVRV